MECPVRYCGHRPNVTWCKLNGADCFLPEDRFRIRTSWEERFNKSIFMLHFELVLPSDNGSYRCSVNASSHVIHSHSITIHVTGKFLNLRPSNVFLIFSRNGRSRFLDRYVRDGLSLALRVYHTLTNYDVHECTYVWSEWGKQDKNTVKITASVFKDY